MTRTELFDEFFRHFLNAPIMLKYSKKHEVRANVYVIIKLINRRGRYEGT